MSALINSIEESQQHAAYLSATAASDSEAAEAPEPASGKVAKSDGTRARKQKKADKPSSKAKKKRGSAGKAAAKEREASIKPPRMPREKLPPFELSDDDRARLKVVQVLLRKGPDNTFEIGGALCAAQPSIPEKSWSRAIKPLGLTARSAWNYMSVARCLTPFRDALVNADVGQTALYQLARGPHTIVEIVLEAFQRGERLTVAAVRRLVDDALGIKPKPISDALDQGGLAGMRRAAAERLKSEAAELVRLCKAMLAAIKEALKEAKGGGKRVSKGDLAARIVTDAREAYRLVISIAAPLAHPDVRNGTSTGWGNAQVVLGVLGSEPRWPTRAALEEWLTQSVIPTLEFVVHGKSADPAVVAVVNVIMTPTTDENHDAPATPVATETEEAAVLEPVLEAEERAAAVYRARDEGTPIDDHVGDGEFAKEHVRIEVAAPPLAPVAQSAQRKLVLPTL